MSEKRNIRDHKRRLLAAKYELRRKLYKAFCKDPDLPSEMRDKHRYKLFKLPRNSSFAQVRNRCISTGRPPLQTCNWTLVPLNERTGIFKGRHTKTYPYSGKEGESLEGKAKVVVFQVKKLVVLLIEHLARQE